MNSEILSFWGTAACKKNVMIISYICEQSLHRKERANSRGSNVSIHKITDIFCRKKTFLPISNDTNALEGGVK